MHNSDLNGFVLAYFMRGRAILRDGNYRLFRELPAGILRFIFENYPYCDENLYYFSASPWEAEFKVANRNLRIAPALIEGLYGVYSIMEEFFNPELGTRDSNEFYLLVRFEESDNLVWLASVLEKDGMLYLECTVRSTSEDRPQDHSYLPLGEEYSQIIADLIGYELEKPASTGAVTAEVNNAEITE